LKSVMHTWQRFWRTSSDARGIVLEAACALTAARVSLHAIGFRRCKTAIERLTPAVRNGLSRRPEIEFAHAIGRWESAAARHLPFTTNCLDRSLALWWLLRRRGIAADLRIGGRKQNGQFQAHAWVELDGVVLDDRTADGSDFVPFESRMTALETQVR